MAAGLVSVLLGLAASAGAAPGQWDQPAAALAEQIAGILGPGEAHLTIRNLSTISTDAIPGIRRLLVEDLKSHGVAASGVESANAIRVTLSENARERLWVAEVVEGNETRVAMVHVDPAIADYTPLKDRIVLRKERYLDGSGFTNGPNHPDAEPVLAMAVTNTGLAVLEEDQIVVVSMTTAGWMARASFALGRRGQLPRDTRGVLIPSADGNGFTAYTAGVECNASHSPDATGSSAGDGWTVHCHQSDDPWPIAQPDSATGTGSLRAFYNSARNYFTGVVTPSLGVDLPPFYTAAALPRPASGVALLVNGIDGKVQIVESGTLKAVSGARDWGSDFAAIHSGCGAGTQIVASGSGEAATDSLRAYELPAQEAVPASAPLSMDGSVTGLWTSPDGKSVLAVVRNASDQYEVDRVTALCN